ncbi:MAG: hypothetical protein CMO26_24020 [Thiotrichales bacterium]|nr:hypothetical protein [Thiotrichales bacterium]|tara:strand:- start:1289 stop:2473 length:1185 start_codon:yes stop_codon:yes gene_type:complete
MNIAIVTNFFPPIQTGSCFWAMNLARAHRKAGDDVVVVTIGTGEQVLTETIDDVTVYRLPAVWKLPKLQFFLNFDSFYLINDRRNRESLGTILRDHQVEIVHQSNHLLDSLFMVRDVCKRLDLPWISTLHGSITHSGNTAYNTIMRGVDRLVIKKAVDACAALVSLDAELVRYVERTYQPRRSALIPLCCMDADFFSDLPTANPERQIMHGDTSGFSIASIGHVTENRNRVELIRAIADLRDEGEIGHLDIVGRVLSQAPVELGKCLGLTDQITFHGELPQKEMLQLLASAQVEAHLFFMPGLGCATQEAMAVGLPTICHGYEKLYGDVPLRHGENIFFADPKNPEEIPAILLELAQNPERRKSVGSNARQLVGEHLVWEVVLTKFQDLYASVM